MNTKKLVPKLIFGSAVGAAWVAYSTSENILDRLFYAAFSAGSLEPYFMVGALVVSVAAGTYLAIHSLVLSEHGEEMSALKSQNAYLQQQLDEQAAKPAQPAGTEAASPARLSDEHPSNGADDDVYSDQQLEDNQSTSGNFGFGPRAGGGFPPANKSDDDLEVIEAEDEAAKA